MSASFGVSLAPWIVVGAMLTSACSTDEVEAAPEEVVPCEALLGQPSDNTGLDGTACVPACSCGDAPWTPAAYSPDFVEDLTAWTLLDPPGLLDSDPYESPPAEALPSATVCAAALDADALTYSLQTYPSATEASLAGAVVTHSGACGLCSSLQNLAVYMGQPDLTGPVRDCGLEGLFGTTEDNIACLEAIGFDAPCAQIWTVNRTTPGPIASNPALRPSISHNIRKMAA